MRIIALLLLTGALVCAAGCLNSKTDRCYLPMDRYEPMKILFMDTGSMQRVEQSMEALKWADCERNQLRYMLAKDLYLDNLVEDFEGGAGS